MGISPRSRCSARSSMALIAYSPLAEILIRAASPRAQAALEQPRRLPGEVGDDDVGAGAADPGQGLEHRALLVEPAELAGDRKSTRLNSSHLVISYAVFCLKKKKKKRTKASWCLYHSECSLHSAMKECLTWSS